VYAWEDTALGTASRKGWREVMDGWMEGRVGGMEGVGWMDGCIHRG